MATLKGSGEYTVSGAAAHQARVYDESGNVIETHERQGDFKDWLAFLDKESRHL